MKSFVPAYKFLTLRISLWRPINCKEFAFLPSIFDLLTFRTFYIFLILFSMNLCTYYCLCGFMIGVHLYILCVQWFYAACSLALRWPWGSSLCPCWPQDWVIVLYSWWSCQHNSSIRMQSQECTCLRYWGCITLALHSLQADFNLAIWFRKSVTLAALGASVIASLELYVGEVVKCLCALVLEKIPSFIWGWQMFVLWLWYPLDCFNSHSI